MARSEQEVDWQMTKWSVLERSRHMFNNPFMSDVAFSCEGSDKKFFAHKYVLGTSSAVFYVMFYGELAEKSPVVHLSDTDAESLEEFLRFLYTDECHLTTDNVLFVLYLARKYIVPSLAEKCLEFLEANFTAENVLILMQQAIKFDEKKLEEECWNFIELHAHKVVVCDEFTNISQATLAELVKREPLNVEEVVLFKAILKWSEAECLRKGIEANPKNKRAVMGNSIYQIRFASMTLQDFGKNASQSGILTSEEMLLFYEKFSGVEKRSEAKVWNMSGRRAKGDSLLRCSIFGKSKNTSYSSTNAKEIPQCKMNTLEDAVDVSFDKAVKIHGVRLHSKEQGEYNVKLEVCSSVIQKKFYHDRGYGASGFDVMLHVPIKVQARVPVHLKVTMTGCHCSSINAQVTRVKRKVIANDAIDDKTVKNSQFDEIILSVAEIRHFLRAGDRSLRFHNAESQDFVSLRVLRDNR